ncbi:MAG: hypothetical protein OXL37_10435 [Chloroflexota bacterium]|nr:hypothetical protein [Chloroflexota bacterium]MDE2960566.1 hypothetical protein [Chloroflexota bacterium]
MMHLTEYCDPFPNPLTLVEHTWDWQHVQPKITQKLAELAINQASDQMVELAEMVPSAIAGAMRIFGI